MNEEEILKKLLVRPETARSLLGASYGRNTTTVCMKRKILRNIKYGMIRRVLLNGSRGGESLYIHRDKKYFIIIIAEHRKFRYFVCDNVKKKPNSVYICIENPRELIIDRGWIDLDEDLKIFAGNVIKVI